jgi:Fur family ferric uptake transcriptional regulator
MDHQRLRKVGLKVTYPRLKILNILEEQAQLSYHISAEEIHTLLQNTNENLGLGTIYRTLACFEKSGLVTRHNFEEGYSVFELNDDEHHDHLVCVRCGRVDEFSDPLIMQRQIMLAQQRHFKVTSYNFTLYGICQNCQQTQSV